MFSTRGADLVPKTQTFRRGRTALSQVSLVKGLGSS